MRLRLQLEESLANREEVRSNHRHGKLLRLDSHQVGREVIVHFYYFTADAHGMT